MLATPDPFDNNKGNKKIPVPDGAYPYIGHIVTFSLNPLKTTKDWHNRYGPLMHIRMGVQHWLLAGDPYFAHKLFVTNGAASSSRPRNNDILKNLMNGERGLILVPYGSFWKKSRNAALTILAPKKLDVYSESIGRESSALVERLISSSEKEAVSPRNHSEFQLEYENDLCWDPFKRHMLIDIKYDCTWR
ncbi:cytochrome P450 [Pilobolus umbonatus]|nr:cytochrome P450 [Pilobolus umbonatus]